MLCRSHKLLSPANYVFQCLNSKFATKSSSSNLSKLRKVTGHPFGFCREALAACDGDYERALGWLQEEATKRGMAKAEKLKSRPMSQGLIGMISTSRCVAAVEVNCETDFVARNQEFQSLVASTTESLFKNLLSATRESGTYRLSEEVLKTIPYASSPKSISEALAEAVASLGENMAIPQGVGMTLSADKANEKSRLMAYCHMSTAGVKKGVRDVQFGKYVAIVRYRHINNLKGTLAWQEQASRVSHQLCQHIVGMNPRPGVSFDDTPPAKNPDEERCLLRQPFLLDESLSVAALLEQNEILLEDFVRVECGLEND
ncbi:unnamed protein product [Mesocestoides corti]|uniref:Elongation factor Ts, mitochondrial n=1 Tax=Mesocestoides corti TaxID=53468 RepID=A0A0R3U4G9_MESCO|nr:unnamed protein product [Mesocestoides corti]